MEVTEQQLKELIDRFNHADSMAQTFPVRSRHRSEWNGRAGAYLGAIAIVTGRDVLETLQSLRQEVNA